MVESAIGHDEALRVPDLTPGARRILDASADLFYRQGIHAVGVDAIAAASGVTKRTLYDRFGSKDALVAAYLQARHAAWWDRLEQRLAGAAAPRVLAVFDAYALDAPAIDRGCGFLNAAGELPAGHPGHAVIRAHKTAVRSKLEELLRADGPDAPDAAALADHLFLLLEGGVAQRGIDGDGRMLAVARDIAERLVG
ncbi:TetR/AcrR family transcriptional regulator [Aeromicrobium choanae]|uniref:Transcriptional regulator, TetR family n=1 Tax=Aeromicrobium choanae TaxID=1736691 RepID=A0A1T4Z790_9ACTN|nr:TetR/AcrR family transcriptional regulator [Aeromicrobium choanae]SKB09879.1 transcriptional regulator, TetR family [Aeromicrobium choanae]